MKEIKEKELLVTKEEKVRADNYVKSVVLQKATELYGKNCSRPEVYAGSVKRDEKTQKEYIACRIKVGRTVKVWKYFLADAKDFIKVDKEVTDERDTGTRIEDNGSSEVKSEQKEESREECAGVADNIIP